MCQSLRHLVQRYPRDFVYFAFLGSQLTLAGDDEEVMYGFVNRGAILDRKSTRLNSSH